MKKIKNTEIRIIKDNDEFGFQVNEEYNEVVISFGTNADDELCGENKSVSIPKDVFAEFVKEYINN